MTPFARLSARLVVVVLAAVSMGCGRHDSTPEVLMDGSKAGEPSLELEDLSGQAVMTHVRTLDAGKVTHGSRVASCLRGPARGARPQGQVVERIGVTGESVTLRDAAGLHACDNSRGPREGHSRWCGSAFGRLDGGHLRDPRLDIAGCRAADGDVMAFAWVVTGPKARYLVVAQPGYSEVYRAVAGLPVRVSTVSGLRSEPLGATFDVSEHDRVGALLRRYRLEAYPAG